MGWTKVWRGSRSKSGEPKQAATDESSPLSTRWGRLFVAVALQIRKSLQLKEILQSTADEVRCLLGCDRTLIYPFDPGWSGRVALESVSAPQWSLLDRVVHDPCFQSNWLKLYREQNFFVVEDTRSAHLSPCHAELLAQLQVRANLVLPILVEDRLWGLLVAHSCSSPREWQSTEVEGAQQIALQIGIAIRQGELIEALQAAKAQLEVKSQETHSQLQQSQERILQLAAIVESSQDAIISETLDSIITSWNAAAERLFGYSAQEVLGKPISVLIPPEKQVEADEVLSRIGQGQPANIYETQRLRKDGQLLDIALTISPVYNQNGQVVGASKIARDISDLKRNERARQAAEQALLESQNRFQAFMTHAPILTWLVDIDGIVSFANPAWLAFVGHSSESAVGHSHDELFSEKFAQEYRRNNQQVIETGQVLETQEQALSAEGRVHTFLVRKFPVYQGNQIAWVGGLAIDITERIQIEKALRESELRWQFAIEGAGDGLWDWNAQTDEVFFSHQFKAMLGYEDSEIGSSLNVWNTRVHPDDKAQYYADLTKHFSGETPTYQSEHRMLCKDGSYKWILDRGKVTEWTEDGKPLRVIGTHTDISDRKQVEEQLRQSESTNRAILAAIPDLLLRVGRDGTCYDFLPPSDNQNNEFLAVHQHLCEVLPPDLLVQQLEGIGQALASNHLQIWDQQLLKHNHLCYEEVRIVPCGSDECLVIVRNITQQKQAEIALKTTKEQLELFIQATSEGFWDWNLVTGAIYFSPRWKEMLGYADHELENSLEMWKSVIFKEDQTAAFELIEDYNSGKVSHCSATHRFHHKNGSTVHVFSRAIHLKDEQGNIVRMVGSHLDVTPTVEMQAALRTSEMQLSSILNSSYDGIMAFRSVRDEQSRVIDFEWLLANPTACEMVSRNPTQLIGNRLLQEMPGNRDEGLFDQYVQVVESGKLLQRQFYYNQDGIDSWFENVAVKLGDGFVVTFRNITQVKQSEQALQRANLQLEAHLEDLKQRNQEMLLLSETSDFLQACLSLEEACAVITSLVEPLFPRCSGGIFITSASRNRVENVATWGTHQPSHSDFGPHDCWSLRRGRPHWVGQGRKGLLCNHVHNETEVESTLCIPMIAQGETLGLFYLSAETPTALPEVKRQLARTVAEQVALAIANLHLRETLQHQSIRDPLTGLFNRRYLEETLQQEISRAQRHQQPIGVIMVDVDYFKRFNDTYGHEAGDYVLQAVGKLIRESVRGSDVACRYGGEEIILVLPEASLAGAQARAEELRKAICQLKVAQGGRLLDSLTASFGVSCFPQHGATGGALIQAADAALYQAKAAGRNQVIVAS